MTPSNMTARVTAATCVLVALLAAPAGWLGGSTAALGVLAGGALAVVNFRWLAAPAVALAFVASRRLELVPRGVQNVLEVVLVQCEQLIDEVIGPQGRPYLPLVATLGLFILCGNLLGLVPGLAGPTANLNTTAACALVVFCTYHYIGIRKHGLIAYLKHFTGPVPLLLKPLMFVIEMFTHLARPLSLTVRLFGNMFGGHILLAMMFFLMGLDGLLGWALSGSAAGAVLGSVGAVIIVACNIVLIYPLKILVAFLQPFLVQLLTMVYIAGAVEGHEAHHH